MSKQQTAVDWLAHEINRRGPKENNPPQWLHELYEQAKAMEKEQHENTWVFALTYGIETMKGLNDLSSKNAFEQYYNETYG